MISRRGFANILQCECKFTVIHCKLIKIYFWCVANETLTKRPVQKLQVYYESLALPVTSQRLPLEPCGVTVAPSPMMFLLQIWAKNTSGVLTKARDYLCLRNSSSLSVCSAIPLICNVRKYLAWWLFCSAKIRCCVLFVNLQYVARAKSRLVTEIVELHRMTSQLLSWMNSTIQCIRVQDLWPHLWLFTNYSYGVDDGDVVSLSYLHQWPYLCIISQTLIMRIGFVVYFSHCPTPSLNTHICMGSSSLTERTACPLVRSPNTTNITSKIHISLAMCKLSSHLKMIVRH